MTLYLDASCIVTIFVPESETSTVIDFVESAPDVLLVSDFGVGEVASAVSRKVRERQFGMIEARAVLTDFDAWALHAASVIRVGSAEIRRAVGLVRQFELKLRMPDALHIAMAEAQSARLLTRDRLMADAAIALGIEVEALQ